jgi:hypothetical protein
MSSKERRRKKSLRMKGECFQESGLQRAQGGEGVRRGDEGRE